MSEKAHDEIQGMFLKFALFSLSGDEQIVGINPKLMKDIITHRHLLLEPEGWESFRKAIGGRRFENILTNPNLMRDSPLDRYKLRIIELSIQKKIAEYKLEAYSDPFSNAPVKLSLLKELQQEWKEALDG